jgi:hypothetical protein
MTDYTKTTNFAAKDSLPSGNSGKIVKGSEIDTEFNNIATAVATKANIAAPTLTGTVTLTGLLSVPDGTASSPSFTNTGDTNVGLFFSGTDTMAFTAGGTSQVTFADGVIAPVTTNDVDLGTSSLQFKDLFLAGNADFNGNLDVDGTTNLDAVDIDGAVDMASTLTLAGNADFNGDLDVDGTTNLDVVDIDGAVDMASTLNVTGGITGTTATLTTAGNTAQLVLKSTDDDTSVGPRLDLTRDSGSPADGDAAGQIRFLADNDAGTELSFGFVRMLLTDVSDGAEDGQFEIDTRVNGTNRNRLNITSTETVFNEEGINLDFRVESSNTQGMFIVDAGDDVVKMGGFTGSGSGTLKVKSNSSHHAIAIEENSGSEVYSLGVVADGSLIFANSGTEVVRFDDSGNVGIGQSTPATRLDVNGGLHSDHATFTSVAGRGLKISTETRDGQNDGIGVLDAQDTEGTKGIISLQSGGTETARVTTSQVLVGQTSGSAADEGVILQKTGEAFVTNDGDTALYCRRLTNNGEIINFKKNNVTVGSIGVNSTALFVSSPTGSDSGLKFGDQQVVPCTTAGASRDDAINLGTSSNRFNTLFATSSTINTSDRNEKQDIEELSDAEKRVAVAAKGLLRKYRWKSSVAEKGDDARIHFGIIAQDLEAAFKAEGLDAGRYGMWCSDTFWVDSEGDTYDTQEEAPEGATEQTRLGVRYSQVLAFIIAAI